VDGPSRIAAPDDPRKVFAYLIALTFDDKGNAARYDYLGEDGAGVNRALAREAGRRDADRAAQRYLKSIRYGTVQPHVPDYSASRTEPPVPADSHFQVALDYGDHARSTPSDPDARALAESVRRHRGSSNAEAPYLLPRRARPLVSRVSCRPPRAVA
jgi:hypothetical protein